MAGDWYERMLLPLADGRELEVFLAGAHDGVPLLYHNGTPSAGIPYRSFAAIAAARGLRLVTYSRAGYAGSSRNPGRSVASVVPDVVAILDHLGASSCYVAGWSGGGPHCLATVALLSERVIAGALLAGVAPYPAEGLDWMEGMGLENHEEFGAALESPAALQAFLEEQRTWMREVQPDEVAAGFGDLISEADRDALSGTFADWMAELFRASVSTGIWGWFDDDLAFLKPWGFDLARISRPVTIWQGAQDRMVPFAHGTWLAEHVAGATPRLLPEHGHLSLAIASFERIADELLSAGG